MNVPRDPRALVAAARLRQDLTNVPRVGVVLGSGLGAFAESLEGLVQIPYAQIPNFASPRVPGHAGSFCFGTVEGVSVACLRGRVHLYEGHDVADVVLGCHVLAEIGCEVVLLTNAAGGIRQGFLPGSLMLITDHLNLTGKNPLLGAPAFVDMTRAYDLDVAGAARAAAAKSGIALQEGVYAGLLGPSYETPAEIRMLRALGADAVGMSTVMEVIALRALGLKVGAVSCITNLAAGLSPALLDHRDVEATARDAKATFEALLRAWIASCGRIS
jgi:purine-nucleoside phosphorylase